MADAPPLTLRDFDFELPLDLIAQRPLSRRDESRLLVVDRASRSFTHTTFPQISLFLKPGDALILNNTRVRPARLIGAVNGRRVELLLIEQRGRNRYLVLAKPAKRLIEGARIEGQGWQARCGASLSYGSGMRLPEINFMAEDDIEQKLDTIGHMPLPPYIKRPAGSEDRERYQTVFGVHSGAIAAPTAGLHFTPELLQHISHQGAALGYVTLHVGIGTFTPVRSEDLARHRMHAEYFILPEDTARLVRDTRQAGGRVCAVGTTVCRVLETCSRHTGAHSYVEAMAGETDIFIRPPYSFNAVDMLLTNFHLPRSTLLMLVSAFAGRELILEAYREAIARKYRFFSYGDAMLIL